MIKLKVREESLSFAAAIKRNIIHEELELVEQIALLERELKDLPANAPQKTNLTEQLESCKTELEQIIRWCTQGAILRCKAKWYNEGEKSTKYFLNLNHFRLSTISQLKISEHEFVTLDKDILTECETYFSELYSSCINQKLPENNFFEPKNETVLNDDESASCEGLLTEKECLEALKNMEPDKTPGTDGLPADFYKIFWKDLSPFLISCFNYAMTQECSQSHRDEVLLNLYRRKIPNHTF